MEQQQRSLVFTAAVGLIILAIIVGSIYYLVKFIQTRVSSSRSTPAASVQVAQTSNNPTATASGSQVVFVPAASNAPRNVAQASTPASAAPRIAQASAQPQQGQGNPGTDRKFIDNGDFQINAPKNWGLLKCNNSDNLELDPTNSADTTIACDIAVKPVTIVVGDSIGCAGETVNLGNTQVSRTRSVDGNYIKYQWCTKTSPVLNITHRVSQGAERATSKQDFSKDVEDLISKLTFVHGS